MGTASAMNWTAIPMTRLSTPMPQSTVSGVRTETAMDKTITGSVITGGKALSGTAVIQVAEGI